jgi:transcriptional regulator GlxA family with amidase domain
MHKVAVVVFDGVVAFDLSVPCEVFARARLPPGDTPAYEVRVCGVSEGVRAGLFELRAPGGLAELAEADTIVVPGVDDLDRPVPPSLVEALRSAHARGTRIASVCSGAFLLAAAGLLDGRRATTHWLAASELARRYPRVQVEPAVLYVDEGQVLTSAGAAAGLDLCLHLVRRDWGAAVAAQTARLSVMPLERAGGQAQFITHEPPPPDGASLEPVLRWMEENSHRELVVSALARKAAMSPRTFLRRFREQTGTTPARWLTRTRVRRAQQLLETTALSVEEIAGEVGFGASSTLRERFGAVVGTSPQAYRTAFRSSRP